MIFRKWMDHILERHTIHWIHLVPLLDRIIFNELIESTTYQSNHLPIKGLSRQQSLRWPTKRSVISHIGFGGIQSSICRLCKQTPHAHNIVCNIVLLHISRRRQYSADNVARIASYLALGASLSPLAAQWFWRHTGTKAAIIGSSLVMCTSIIGLFVE